jgi:hypothetical protein
LLSPQHPHSTAAPPPSISSIKMAGEQAADQCRSLGLPAARAEATAACALQHALADSGVTRTGIGFPEGQVADRAYSVACSFNAHWKYSWRTFRGWVMGTHSGRCFSRARPRLCARWSCFWREQAHAMRRQRGAKCRVSADE